MLVDLKRSRSRFAVPKSYMLNDGVCVVGGVCRLKDSRIIFDYTIYTIAFDATLVTYIPSVHLHTPTFPGVLFCCVSLFPPSLPCTLM